MFKHKYLEDSLTAYQFNKTTIGGPHSFLPPHCYPRAWDLLVAPVTAMPLLYEWAHLPGYCGIQGSPLGSTSGDFPSSSLHSTFWHCGSKAVEVLQSVLAWFLCLPTKGCCDFSNMVMPSNTGKQSRAKAISCAVWGTLGPLWPKTRRKVSQQPWDFCCPSMQGTCFQTYLFVDTFYLCEVLPAPVYVCHIHAVSVEARRWYQNPCNWS